MTTQNERERREEAVRKTSGLEPARDNSPVVSNPDSEIQAKQFDILVYHVIDKNGTHRFLTMNSLDAWFSEGREGFERVLARQYKTFEWLGSMHVLVNSNDPTDGRFLDPDGCEELRDRVRALMDTFPNSSGHLEAWLPDAEERVEYAPSEPVRSPWRPMSTLKQAMGGKVDLDRIAITFLNEDVCAMVKPEFVEAVKARGAAFLREFKEDVRESVEPSFRRAIEGPTEVPGRQDAPADPDECERGVTFSREEKELARKLCELRHSQTIEGIAEVSDRQGGPAALDEGER